MSRITTQELPSVQARQAAQDQPSTAPTSSSSKLEALPLDVAYEVLKRAPIETQGNVRATSHALRDAVARAPELDVHAATVDGYLKKASPRDFMSILKALALISPAARARLTSLDLSNFDLSNHEMKALLFHLARETPNLQHLDLGGPRSSGRHSRRVIPRMSLSGKLGGTVTEAQVTRMDVFGLPNLKTLSISSQRKLEALAVHDLPELDTLTVRESGLTEGPELDNLPRLRSLDLRGSSKLMSLPTWGPLPALEKISLAHCESLTTLPPLTGCGSLRELDASDNISLRTVYLLPAGLERLTLNDCPVLADLSGLLTADGLKELQLRKCPLTDIPFVGACTALEVADFSDSRKLEDLDSLEHSASLKELKISGCDKLEELPDLDVLTALVRIEARGLHALLRLPAMDLLAKLAYLDLTSARRLTALPDLSHNRELRCLKLADCRSLRSVGDLSRLEHLDDIEMDKSHVLSPADHLPPHSRVVLK